MTIQSKQGHRTSGEHLRKLVNLGSIGGLLFSLIGTGLVWAGSDSFNCPTIVWKVSLALNLAIFGLTWIVYIPFRNTDLLLGNGLIMATVLLNMFSTFWLGGFYFYFLFAPINTLLRSVVLISMTATLLHRAYKIRRDIDDAFRKNKKLFNNMYCDEGTSITFKREAIGLLERSRRERTPFNPTHAYAAIFIAPFILVLNKSLTPVLGEGHGVFLVLAFFAIPMMLWSVDLFVQTTVAMVYYPIKLRRDTGKMTVLKDW